MGCAGSVTSRCRAREACCDAGWRGFGCALRAGAGDALGGPAGAGASPDAMAGAGPLRRRGGADAPGGTGGAGGGEVAGARRRGRLGRRRNRRWRPAGGRLMPPAA